MSDITECNYCGLKGVKRRAEAQGLAVTVIGSDVYRHDKSIDVTMLPAPAREQYWVCWMMTIPASCCC